MEAKSVTGMIMGLFVAITVVAVIMMPVLSDAVAPNGNIYTNEGAYYIEVTPSDTYTLSYNYNTTPGVVTINDGTVTIDDFSEAYAVLATDTMRIVTQNNAGMKLFRISGIGSNINLVDRFDITVSNGSVSGTYYQIGDSTASTLTTTSYTTAYVATSTEQEQLMTEAGSTIYVKGDSQIVAVGSNPTSAPLFNYIVSGNVDDGVEVTLLNLSTGEELTDVTISNLAVNATEITDGIYTLESVTFTATKSGNTVDMTVTEFIAPSQIVDQYYILGSGERAILGAIPLVIIAAIVLGSVALVATRRD